MIPGFQNRQVLLAVVHPISREAALKSVEAANEGGADGVFLINQGMDIHDVIRLLSEIRRTTSGLWFGLNALGWSVAETENQTWPDRGPVTALAQWPTPDAIWSDSAGPRFQSPYRGQRPLYFGGVAFKSGDPDLPFEHFPAAVRAAYRNGVDIVTTSGARTGSAPAVEKVRRLAEVIGPRESLAIASGVDADNVRSFLPWADAFLVGTGIEKSVGVIDRDLVRELSDIIHAGI